MICEYEYLFFTMNGLNKLKPSIHSDITGNCNCRGLQVFIMSACCVWLGGCMNAGVGVYNMLVISRLEKLIEEFFVPTKH